MLQDRKHTVCRHIRASFSPEIVQAVTVKGLRRVGGVKVGGGEWGGNKGLLEIKPTMFSVVPFVYFDLRARKRSQFCAVIGGS